jgi:hypothetical protein
MKCRKLASWRRDILVLFYLSFFGCRFEDTSILIGDLNLFPSVSCPIFGFLIFILLIDNRIFRLLLDLIALFRDVSIGSGSPLDFILDLHGLALLFFGHFGHVDLGRVDIVIIRRTLALKLVIGPA